MNEEIDQAPIIFTGHLDTVFLEGTAAKNPFRIDEDGMMHGPGIDDMKSGIVIGLYTLLALKMIGYQERPIKFIMVTDEENLHMFSKAKDKIRQEAQGGLYALNFESGYLDDAIVVSRKGGGIVDIEVTGVAAHSGHDPEKGRSAILELAHKIIAIEALNDIPRGKLLNCGKIIGGTGDNVVSDKATVSVGIRYDSMTMRQEILDDLKTIIARATIPDTETSLFLRILIDPLEHTPAVQMLFDYLAKTAQEIGYGDVYAKYVGGASDSGLLVSMGIPLCAQWEAREATLIPWMKWGVWDL
ncbi:M20/M25/M40 family metallo-hydrolase [Streptococcus pluranimalium]|uniref:M20/M25/M40 family metallo-hydrolase n=1 Tax=Streptococcus pluranimalium TaxID=82348 RepID=UPI003F670D48